MGKFIDLTGLIFGRLKVIERDGSKNAKHIFWICLCDCGKTKSINGNNLKNKQTTSCGCIKRSDLEGRIFSRLKVIQFSHVNKHRQTMWIVKCECGILKCVMGSSLIDGSILSCGCLNKENAVKVGKSRFIDLTNKKFGKLTVLNVLNKNNQGNYIWKCSCDCGNTTNISSGSLINKKTISCGCLSESYIASELKKYCKKKYKSISEYKEFRNPETGHYLPFDIFIPKYDIYIEVHGIHHYVYHGKWHRNQEGFKKQKQKDKSKKKHARKYGFYIEIDLRKITTIEDTIEYIEGKIFSIKNNEKTSTV